MASFVEQATLVVKDSSSANLNKINASLKKLFVTARSLKGINVKLQVDDGQVKKASASIRQLRVELRLLGNLSKRIKIDAQVAGFGKAAAAVKGMTRNMQALNAVSQQTRVNVNTHAITLAHARLNALRTAAGQPINVRMLGGRLPGAGGGAGGGGGTTRGRRTASGAAAQGFSSGLGLGGAVSGVNSSFYALQAAGYLAAAALRSVADAAKQRERSALQAAVAATEAQRKVFAESGDRSAGLTAISLTKAERDRLRTSLLGDVQGNEVERARAAVNIARQLEETVLPRLFAQAPDKSREETLEGLRKLIQGVNLASTDIVDASGQFSKDGLRVLNGIQRAMAADPDITPQLIKTALANAKTAGLSLNEDSIARLLINAGTRGVRAANETFRAIKAASGTVDSKALNNSLATMGLLQNVKRNERKNVIAGSGTPVDDALLNQDPAVWFQKNFVPIMDKALTAAGKDTKSAADRIAFINKSFAGMSSAGLQGITDMILGFDQMNASLAQSKSALEQNVPEAIAKSWAAQAENVAVAWKDAAGNLGQELAKQINLPAIFEGIATKLREEPGKMAAISAAAAAPLAGVLATALIAPATSLTAAGVSLQAAAAALAAANGVNLPGGGGGGKKGSATGRVLKTLPLAATAVVIADEVVPDSIKQMVKEGVEEIIFGPKKNDAELRKQTQALESLYEQRGALKDLMEAASGGAGRDNVKTRRRDEDRRTQLADLERQIGERQAKIDRMTGGTELSSFDIKNANIDRVNLPTPQAGAGGSIWGDGKATAPKPGELQSVANTVDTSLAGFMQSLGLVAQTSSAFQTVFSTGAQQIGASGTQVVSTISEGMPGAGSALGNAAVAAIRAGVANLNISVNANVNSVNSGAKTGGIQAD